MSDKNNIDVDTEQVNKQIDALSEKLNNYLNNQSVVKQANEAMNAKLMISNSILENNSQQLLKENEDLESMNSTLNEKLKNITKNLEKLGEFTSKIDDKELKKLPASIQNLREQIFENIKDGALDIFDELSEVDTDEEMNKIKKN